METTISFTVNGKSRRIATDSERPLLDLLREDLQLTGPKFGCGEGQCRACTVLLDGKSVASCITRAADANGKKILTIEGLASRSSLHPVQKAFLEENAFQCGYCTSGMILGTVALLNEFKNPTDEQILSRMNRHLCRCCSYPHYLKAIRRAAIETAKESA